MLVHDSMSFPKLSDDYFRAEYDQELLVKVTPKQIRTTNEVAQMDFFKRKCHLPHERVLKYFTYYTVSNCQLECLANATIRDCDCVLFYLPSKYQIFIYSRL